MSLSKIRLGAISFINTLPIYFPFKQPEGPERLELFYGAPSALNKAMDRGTLDVSPVSSAFYLRNQEKLVLLKDLSVSSYGAVESVLFLSKVPIGKALLDQSAIAVPDASETSIALLAFLLQEKTGHDFQPWFETYPASQYWEALQATGSILIIGDDALKITSEGIPAGYYCYDLASLWAEQTALPFVFAVWVARKTWAMEHPEQLNDLNERLIEGRNRFFNNETLLEEGVRIARTRCTISPEKVRSYFTHSLSYELTPAHQSALNHFERILHRLDTATCEQPPLTPSSLPPFFGGTRP